MRRNLFKPHCVTLIHRLQEDRAERLGRVAKLYIQGRFTMRQIANEIGNGVTVKQIERDSNHIRQLCNKAASKDLKVYLSRELATIDRVEAVCWEAW